jgi:hypothetical protein
MDEIVCRVPVTFDLVEEFGRFRPPGVPLALHIQNALMFAWDHKEVWCPDTNPIREASTPSK